MAPTLTARANLRRLEHAFFIGTPKVVFFVLKAETPIGGWRDRRG
jgi:hypothetical protein